MYARIYLYLVKKNVIHLAHSCRIFVYNFKYTAQIWQKYSKAIYRQQPSIVVINSIDIWPLLVAQACLPGPTLLDRMDSVPLN